jgi:hypothetical protein
MPTDLIFVLFLNFVKLLFIITELLLIFAFLVVYLSKHKTYLGELVLRRFMDFLLVLAQLPVVHHHVTFVADTVLLGVYFTQLSFGR